MNRPLLVPLVTFGLILGAAVPALAQYSPAPYGQYYNPYSRPPGINPGGGPRLNPYLNLFRGNGVNNNPAINYYLGVVPEIERRRFQAQTQSTLTDLSQRLPTTLPLSPEEGEVVGPLSIAGHPTAFMNTGAYFGGTGPLPVSPRNVPMTPLPPRKNVPARPK